MAVGKEAFSLFCCVSLTLMNYSAVWAGTETNWTEINEICGISYSDRIVGGTKAGLGQFPWIAHLGLLRRLKSDEFSISYECGGALIHPRFVLTAAHCVIGLGEEESLSVVKLGEHNLETKIDCEGKHCSDPPQVINAKTISIPKEYDDKKLRHDVALIELFEPANLTHYVSPICLPTRNMTQNNLLKELVEVAGWGWFDVDDPKESTELQVVQLPVVSIDTCRKIKQLEHYNFTVGQICVGGVAGKDSCNGDSGGPMMKVMSTPEHGPRYFLFGAVSVGVPSCGKFSLPAVYTNVSHYLPWVLDIIEDVKN